MAAAADLGRGQVVGCASQPPHTQLEWADLEWELVSLADDLEDGAGEQPALCFLNTRWSVRLVWWRRILYRFRLLLSMFFIYTAQVFQLFSFFEITLFMLSVSYCHISLT